MTDPPRARLAPEVFELPVEKIANDPAVIASYLGTDERAIQRSGTAADATASVGSGEAPD